MRIAVIGAGMGGLSAAAALAKLGHEVTVLEAHNLPGGCAQTFFHRGCRFDAGATLAGGFNRGGPMALLEEATGARFNTRQADIAMAVHLPGEAPVLRYGDGRWAQERLRAFGPQAERFWQWQESRADLLWAFATHLAPWPPQRPSDLLMLLADAARLLAARSHVGLSLSLAREAVSALGRYLPQGNESLRMFIDAQLLISAQCQSDRANALYGACALDLPRREVRHVAGGIGALAFELSRTLTAHGGRVIFRSRAHRIVIERGRAMAVETAMGRLEADAIIANLTPPSLARLLGEHAPKELAVPPSEMEFGAFTVYAAVESACDDRCLHHQIVLRRPLSEGNSLFASLSPSWDESRAPRGLRALTLSTHTRLEPWLKLRDHEPVYEERKASLAAQLLESAKAALPGVIRDVAFSLAGTPSTFRDFTLRAGGWVGGRAQTSLRVGMAPRVMPGLWLVGDSIFPGQSVAATALGGMRVARQLHGDYSNSLSVSRSNWSMSPISSSISRSMP